MNDAHRNLAEHVPLSQAIERYVTGDADDLTNVWDVYTAAGDLLHAHGIIRADE